MVGMLRGLSWFLDYLLRKVIHYFHHASAHSNSQTSANIFIKFGMRHFTHICPYTPERNGWHFTCFCSHLNHNLLSIYQSTKYCTESCRKMKHPLVLNTRCAEHTVHWTLSHVHSFFPINLTVFESIKEKWFAFCLITWEVLKWFCHHMSATSVLQWVFVRVHQKVAFTDWASCVIRRSLQQNC